MKKTLIIFFVFISVVAYPQTIVVDIDARSVVYSIQHNKAFVIVREEDENYPKNLLQLNPYTGNVEKSLPLNGNPIKIKFTPDHEHVYVSYETLTQIDKVNLFDFQIIENIQLGEYTVLDFDILPSNENILFIVLGKYSSFNSPEKIVMCKDGLLQPKQVDDGFKNASAVGVKHDGTKLYAHNGITSGHQAYLYDVVEDGIIHDGINWEYMMPSPGEIKNHNDLFFGNLGTVVDPFSDSIPLVEAKMPLYKLTDSWPGFDFSEIHNSYIFGHETDYKAYISFFHGQFYNYLGSLLVEGRTDKIGDIDVVDQNHFILISMDSYQDFKRSLLFYNVEGKNILENTNTNEYVVEDWFEENNLIKLPFKNDSINQHFVY